jgi:hypothetical protein
VVCAPLENLLHDGLIDLPVVSKCAIQLERVGTYVGNRDGLVVVAAKILEQVLDEDRALGDGALDFNSGAVGGGHLDLLLGGCCSHYSYECGCTCW